VRLNWPVTALLATGLATTACGTGVTAAQPHPAKSAVIATRATAPGTAGTGTGGATTGGTAAGGGQATAAKPLAGKTVGIDPGHNGRNRDDPTYINHLVWNGREEEACDTTGTETDGGYTEARFNFRIARYLRTDLRRKGARVVLTRKNNSGVGPCVNRRAKILNHAHSNVAIDIHGDGGPATGRGFTVLEPVRDGPNDKVIKSSDRFGRDVRYALLHHTSMPKSNYYGHNGLISRNDLAGLNLATQPKILIECGNMRNATDARLLRAAWFQKRLATAFTDAIVHFLAKH
jgi:N-acetylmuramoyl-L-alanine amidase